MENEVISLEYTIEDEDMELLGNGDFRNNSKAHGH